MRFKSKGIKEMKNTRLKVCMSMFLTIFGVLCFLMPVNAYAQTQTRTVECRDNNGNTVADSFCTGIKPVTTQNCTLVTHSWEFRRWANCFNGTQVAIYECQDSGGNVVDDSFCTETRPTDSQSCGNSGPGPSGCRYCDARYLNNGATTSNSCPSPPSGFLTTSPTGQHCSAGGGMYHPTCTNIGSAPAGSC